MSIASSARGDVDERARRRAVYDAMVVPVLTAHNVPQEAWPQRLPMLNDRYYVTSPKQGERDGVMIQVLLERHAFFVPYPQQDQNLPQRRLPYCRPYRATDRRLAPKIVYWGDDAAAAWDQAKVVAGWPMAEPLQRHQQQQQHQGSSSSSSS